MKALCNDLKYFGKQADVWVGNLTADYSHYSPHLGSVSNGCLQGILESSKQRERDEKAKQARIAGYGADSCRSMLCEYF